MKPRRLKNGQSILLLHSPDEAALASVDILLTVAATGKVSSDTVRALATKAQGALEDFVNALNSHNKTAQSAEAGEGESPTLFDEPPAAKTEAKPKTKAAK